MDTWKVDLWLKNYEATQFINYDGTLQMKDFKAVKQVELTVDEIRELYKRRGMEHLLPAAYALPWGSSTNTQIPSEVNVLQLTQEK